MANQPIPNDTGTPRRHHRRKGDPVLKLGDRGDKVKTLQEELGITADGIFGQQTLHALRVYQRHYGLKITGTTDELTWKTLGTHGPIGGTTIDNTGGGKDGFTAEQFASALLKRLGAPQTAANVRALMGWMQREGGHWDNTARYNPLNTTERMPGSTSMNSVGVQSYKSWQDGLDATIRTLENGRYGNILDALRQGNNLQGVLNAIIASPWSGDHYGGHLTAANGTTAYGNNPGGFGGGAGGSQADANIVKGGGPGQGQLSPQDVAHALDQMGFARALINSDPTLKNAFDEIINRQIDVGTSTGRAEAMAIIKSTKWWQSRSASQRSFDEMSADKSQKATLAQELKQKRSDLEVMAEQLGIPLDHSALAHVATAALRNNLDSNQLQQIFANHLNYKPGGDYTGQLGMDVTGVQKLASDYYVRMGHGQIQDMLQRMIAGGLTPDAMQNFFKQQALSRFPHLQKQINSGLTVADIANPYVQAMSQLLEIDPSGIKPMDPTVMKALQMPDGNGGFQLMPEWQFEQTLREDPRWLKTQNAQNSLMDIGTGLLKQMGLIAAG